MADARVHLTAADDPSVRPDPTDRRGAVVTFPGPHDAPERGDRIEQVERRRPLARPVVLDPWILDPALPERFPATTLEHTSMRRTGRAPNTIQIEAHLRERIDPARLERAVRVAMTRHPMSTVRLDPARLGLGHASWTLAARLDADPLSITACTDDELADVRDTWFGTPLPTQVSLTFRLLLVRTPTHDAVMLRAQHGAFDGAGALAFFHEIGDAYTSTPPTDEAPPTDGAQRDIQRRDVTRADTVPGPARHARATTLLPAPAEPGRAREPGHRLDETIERRAEAVRQAAGSPPVPSSALSSSSTDDDPWRTWLAVRRSARLAPCGGAADDLGCHVVLDRLEPGTTVTLRRGVVARVVPDATDDDLLLVALHQSIARWNARLGRAERTIAVAHPIDGRREHDGHRLVANLTARSITVSTPNDRRHADTLLASIAAQTARLRHAAGRVTEAGPPAMLDRARRCLGSALGRIADDHLVPTAELSNLGRYDHDPFREGGFIADHLWFSPPAPMPQGLAVGTIVFNGVLHLAFRGSRALWDAAATREFASIFRTALDDLR